MLAHTPLHDWHAAHGGRMVDFAGWSMPVQYSSIVDEHHATRRAVGLFDVSHMGRLLFGGPDAARFLDRIVTRRVTDLRPGQVRYALVTNDQGGVLDDVLVYRVREPRGDGSFLQLVVNAGNRQKILDWLVARRGGDEVEIGDITPHTAMIAVQGPRALEIVRPLVELDAARLPYYSCAETRISREPGTISRTGYTGEDGCELVVPSEVALEVWEKLVSAAGQFAGGPAGLGCRDTLRLEAGMPLYGHELDESLDPWQAGLAFAVDLDARDFIGRDALVTRRNDPHLPRRAGWLMEGKRVPRQGYGVFAAGEPVGRVSSGTYSPTLDRPIAMGYVAPRLAGPGHPVEIDIRGTRLAAQSVRLPFYRRST